VGHFSIALLKQVVPMRRAVNAVFCALRVDVRMTGWCLHRAGRAGGAVHRKLCPQRAVWVQRGLDIVKRNLTVNKNGL
jgi:hypothetical protein